MSHTLFMIAFTLLGTVGVFLLNPYLGVWVYYFFAVLRPQYMWEWSLPPEVSWSRFVALATLTAVACERLGLFTLPARELDHQGKPLGWGFTPYAVLGFAIWVVLTYIMGPVYNPLWTDDVLLEYLKIFIMFFASLWVVRRLNQVWALYLVAALSLLYIAYEMNYLYFVNNYLSIYKKGYAKLDNNGAGLMLAMGAPLCLFAWEGIQRWYRWAFLAALPVILHAVLMSYSRGAMLSLLITSPLWLLRSRERFRLGLIFLAVGLLVPVMAGKEIQNRFFTIREHEVDDSAQSRFGSWAAAVRIANNYPIFGAGLRAANILSFQYGADMEGRTIHSQYLQLAADNGWVGLGIYLSIYVGVAFSLHRARRLLGQRSDPEARRAHAMASGVEGALAVFCVGAFFLSLEAFELPYLLILMAGLLPIVKGVATPTTVPGEHNSPASPAAPMYLWNPWMSPAPNRPERPPVNQQPV